MRIDYVIYTLLSAAFIICYYYTFGWLHYKYSYPESYYSHGYLIPFISMYLIFRKREWLKEVKPSSNVIGLAIIIFALLIHIFGTMGDINFFSGFSMFLYIFGCILYLLGTKLTKQIIFPLIFLIFMFPVPDQFINIFGLPSKYIATVIGLKIIDFINIPYVCEGFRINLVNATLFIDTPCNGMKSLISFLAVGLLFLHLINVTIWGYFIVLASIYPVAVLLNGCRVAILVYIANNYGIKMASPDSYLHTMSGVVVFVVGILILIFLTRIVSKDKA